MAKFIKGDVVIVPFPFTDLTQQKRRPALVVAVLEKSDLILCQITSRKIKDKYAVLVDDDDFASGTLKQKSHVRPNRLFTADSGIVLYKAGNLKTAAVNTVIDKIIDILKS